MSNPEPAITVKRVMRDEDGNVMEIAYVVDGQAEEHRVYTEHFMRPPRKNAQRDSEIARAYGEGLPLSEVARKYGLTKARIQQILREQGVKTRPRGRAPSRSERR